MNNTKPPKELDTYIIPILIEFAHNDSRYHADIEIRPLPQSEGWK